MRRSMNYSVGKNSTFRRSNSVIEFGDKKQISSIFIETYDITPVAIVIYLLFI